MAVTIRVKRGTDAAIQAGTLAIGEIAFATDTKACYTYDGVAKVLVGKATVDTLANRPAAGMAGRLFLDTGANALYVDTGAAWISVSSSVQAAGSDKQVQFNDGGARAGAANLTWDKATNRISLTGTSSCNISTLTDGATITPDFSAANNFSVTLGGNRTLANPSNMTVGQSGLIFVIQDATGSRTLAYGTYWHFPGGTDPTASTAANAVDVISYFVRSSTSIVAQMMKDFK